MLLLLSELGIKLWNISSTLLLLLCWGAAPIYPHFGAKEEGLEGRGRRRKRGIRRGSSGDKLELDGFTGTVAEASPRPFVNKLISAK